MSAPDPVRDKFRELFRLYAVPGTRMDNPARCTPGQEELAAHPNERNECRGSTNKVLFASERDAQGFAAGVVAAGLGDDIQEPYYCPRGGHWHLRNATKLQRRLERYGWA